MAIREFSQLKYLPIISVRPAEMRALEELPERTKDQMLPYIPLRPWVGANRLQNALTRIEDAYSDRPIVVGLGEREAPQDRPVFGEIDRLRSPAEGFLEWRNFIDDHDNYIPVLQFDPNTDNETLEIEQLWQLGRGLVVHLPRELFPGMVPLAQRVALATDSGRDVLFVLDFGTVGADHLQAAALVQGAITTIREYCTNCFVATSASSFPPQFEDGVHAQQIFERRLFNILEEQQIPRLIYSDRGSARIERLGGGGGRPYPRIDYPIEQDWLFYRHDIQDGFEGYQIQAADLLRSDAFNPDLRVWGTQMIERTAAGDRSAISNPQKATSARINLHLQVQTFYGDPIGAEATEDDWED